MDTTLLELERLNKGGIRFTISPAAGGFLVQLGDHLHGDAICAHTNTLAEAVAWLRERAKHHYPSSAYSKALLTN